MRGLPLLNPGPIHWGPPPISTYSSNPARSLPTSSTCSSESYCDRRCQRPSPSHIQALPPGPILFLPNPLLLGSVSSDSDAAALSLDAIARSLPSGSLGARNGAVSPTGTPSTAVFPASASPSSAAGLDLACCCAACCWLNLLLNLFCANALTATAGLSSFCGLCASAAFASIALVLLPFVARPHQLRREVR